MLGAKLHDGLFLGQERAARFKDVCRPSQLMLLKRHLSLSHESRATPQPKGSIELQVSKERIAATPDTASAIDSITSMNK